MKGFRRGFTIVELAVVLGIVGILTSIAIPAVSIMQVRARVTEKKTVVTTMARTLLMQYSRDSRWPTPNGNTPVNPPLPVAPPIPAKFEPALGNWPLIEAVPDGICRYRYSVYWTSAPNPVSFSILADGDVDYNGVTDTGTQTWLNTGNDFQLSYDDISNADR